MTWVVSLLGLSVAGIFGVNSIMDNLDDNADSIDRSTMSIGSMAILGVGIYLIINYKKLK